MDFDFFPEEGVRRTENGFSIRPQTLEKLAYKAFKRLSFTFTEEHLLHLIQCALAEDASENDRYTAAFLLQNAATAAEGVFPICQDTGIAAVFGWKDADVYAAAEEDALERGIRSAYGEGLRFSTVCARTFFDEYDPRTNLPAQILLFQRGKEETRTACGYFAGKPYYRFLFCAKGGGSSNKTVFLQETKAALNRESFLRILHREISRLGTAACPPYTIAVVAGGLSPEQNLLALKLATCGFYDRLSDNRGGAEQDGLCFRDRELEREVLRIAGATGLGAQFGGSKLALNAVVLRLSRHGASVPVSIGVSCSAHRNLEAYITEDGCFLQKTVEKPQTLIGFKRAVSFLQTHNTEKELRLNTEDGIDSCLSLISGKLPGSRFLLDGPLLVARDQAHAKWKALIDDGKELPPYCARYPICYAGPAETPPGKIIGSFGPTTAGRMDSYAEMLMSRGAALVTVAKGNRGAAWKDACKKYGACYLGTVGGAAALIAGEHTVSSQIIDYPELGMEAVRLVEVCGLPVFLLITPEGEDFYEQCTRNRQ